MKTESASPLALGELSLLAPIDGVVVPLEDVPDPVFSERMLGDGIAIDPTGSLLVAPCAGTIVQLHRAKHALTLRAAGGVNVLLHVGLDTVNLKGRGFEALVEEGEAVLPGQGLLRLDLDVVAQGGKSALTEIVVTEGGEHFSWKKTSGLVKAGADEVLRVSSDPAARSAPFTETNSGADGGSELEVLSPKLAVKNPHGIHARPAARLSEEAKKYQSVISVHFGEKKASATSVFELMNLDVQCGTEIQIRAVGVDAQTAVDSLSEAVLSGLGEGEESAQPDEPANERLVSKEAGVLGGVPAAPGLFIGTIRIRRLEIPPFEEKGRGVEVETASLLAGLKQSLAQLESEKEQFLKAGEPEKAQIFGAHAEILGDQTLLSDAKKLLSGGLSAPAAFHQVILSRADAMSALKSARMRERADDLRDIGQRVLFALLGRPRPTLKLDRDAVLLAEDLTPSTVAHLSADTVGALLTFSGGATSHAAIIARSMGVPYVAALGEEASALVEGMQVIVDGTLGSVRLSPSEEALLEARKRIRTLASAFEDALSRASSRAATRDGHSVEVAANIGNQKDALAAVEQGCDGVGLLRSELLFMNSRQAPTEEEQKSEYVGIAKILGEKRSLVVRTLDVGGDKPLSYLPQPEEENPFLGIRGLRLSLKHPEMFKVQIRAALFAARHTKLNLMFPMVAQFDEFVRAKEFVQAEMDALGVSDNVALGVMIEVPSAALNARWLAKEADFFSIGTNDLTQYTLAMDRGHPELSKQADAFDPAVLRLIQMTVEAAHAEGKWVGVCGGLAAEPLAAPLLVGLGVDELSVPAPAIAELKDQIRGSSFAECRAVAEGALALPTAQAVRSLLQSFLGSKR